MAAGLPAQLQEILINAGVNSIAVKIMMGHARTVEEGYYKLLDEVAEGAVLKMGLDERIAQERAKVAQNEKPSAAPKGPGAPLTIHRGG